MKRLAVFLKRSLGQRNLRRGMSLIDVLIAMVILLIAIASSMALATHLARTVQTDQRLTAASNLADYKMEELRNYPYADVVDGADAGTLDGMGDSPGDFTRSWSVTSDSPDLGLKTITVTVNWNQAGGAREYELVGVIAE